MGDTALIPAAAASPTACTSSRAGPPLLHPKFLVPSQSTTPTAGDLLARPPQPAPPTPLRPKASGWPEPLSRSWAPLSDLPSVCPLPRSSPPPARAERHSLLPRPAHLLTAGLLCPSCRSLFTLGQVTSGPSSARTLHGPFRSQSHSPHNADKVPRSQCLRDRLQPHWPPMVARTYLCPLPPTPGPLNIQFPCPEALLSGTPKWPLSPP